VINVYFSKSSFLKCLIILSLPCDLSLTTMHNQIDAIFLTFIFHNVV